MIGLTQHERRMPRGRRGTVRGDGPEMGAQQQALVAHPVQRGIVVRCGAIERSGRLRRAVYVERGTMAAAVITPLTEKRDDSAPYFAIVLVPGWEAKR